ncbi:hypothetical protein NQ318_010074 [Aromia moschata]|uniref:Kazal-like domain-containing protein n=1 Tax=Aromia moschata TaxID=1265417 RepID=A0AAV8YGH0_9CUCU|nr:hypothetical protein NQ318_010074 [Aromia moschata]
MAFWNCAGSIENEHRNKITIPFCSSHCGWAIDSSFQPVCVDGRTYFSPCLAGCTNFSSVHNIYRKGSCGQLVTEGSCDAEECRVVLALSLTNSIIASGLLATTVVSSLIINLRCVSNKDKALALGVELTFLGIIPYIPIRIIYYVIAELYCEIDGERGCQFYSKYFPLFVSLATIILMVLASIVAIVLLFFVRTLELYQSKHFSSTSDVGIYEIRNSQNEGGGNETMESGTEDEVRQTNLTRELQLSEGRLNMPRPKSKEDRINMYLSEGELVPSLKQGIKRGETSTSKTSGNSGLSTDSLKVIANLVGDDHDSDTFSESSRANKEHTMIYRRQRPNIVETEM